MLSSLAEAFLQGVVPSRWRVGSVKVELGEAVLSGIDGVVGECRLCWNLWAFVTPLAPFLELHVTNVECSQQDINELIAKVTAEKKPQKPQEFWWLFIVHWILGILLSDVRIAVHRVCVKKHDDESLVVENLKADVSLFPLKVSALVESLRCLVLSDESLEVVIREIRFDYDSTWQLRAPGTSFRRIGGVSRRGPGVDARGDFENADLDVLIDDGVRLASMTLRKKKVVARILAPIDATFPRDDLDFLLDHLQSTEEEEEGPGLDMEVALICRAPTTVLVEELGSVAVDKGAKLALRRGDLRADVPAVYCVAATGTASLHVTDLDISCSKDKRRIRARRSEARLDDLDNLDSLLTELPSSSSSGETTTTPWSIKVDQVEATVEGEVIATATGVAVADDFKLATAELRLGGGRCTVTELVYGDGLEIKDLAVDEPLLCLRAPLLQKIQKTSGDGEKKMIDVEITSAKVKLDGVAVAVKDVLLNSTTVAADTVSIFEDEIFLGKCQGLSLATTGETLKCSELDVMYVASSWELVIGAALNLSEEFTSSSNKKSKFAAQVEHVILGLPAAATSKRCLKLEGRDATFLPCLDDFRIAARDTRILDADDSPVATLGADLDVFLKRDLTSIALDCPFLKCEKFHVDQYRLLRHAIWRNLADADGRSQQQVQNNSEFRIELKVRGVEGRLLDENDEWSVDSKEVILVFDRSESDYFSIRAQAVTIAEMATPKKVSDDALVFAVSSKRTLLKVFGSDLRWQADDRRWWRLKDFFRFSYTRDPRDGEYLESDEPKDVPAALEPETTTPKEEYSFMLAFAESNVVIFDADAEVTVAVSTRGHYEYRWAGDESLGHTLRVEDAAVVSEPRFSVAVNALSLSRTSNIEKVSVAAPDWPALKTQRSRLGRLLRELAIGAGIDVDAPSDGETFGIPAVADAANLTIGSAETIDVKSLTIGKEDVELGELQIRRQKAHVARVDGVALRGSDVTVASLDVTSVSETADIVQAVKEALSLEGGGSASGGGVRIDRTAVGLGRGLAGAVEDLVIGDDIRVGRVALTHKGPVIFETSGASFVGAALDIPKVDARLSPSLITDATQAANDIKRALAPFQEQSAEPGGPVEFQCGELHLRADSLRSTLAVKATFDKRVTAAAIDVSTLAIDERKSVLATPVEIRSDDKGVTVSSVGLDVSATQLGSAIAAVEALIDACPTSSSSSKEQSPGSLAVQGVALVVDKRTRISADEIAYADATWTVSGPTLACDGHVVAGLESEKNAEECLLAFRQGHKLVVGTRSAALFEDNVPVTARVALRGDVTALEPLLMTVSKAQREHTKRLRVPPTTAPPQKEITDGWEARLRMRLVVVGKNSDLIVADAEAAIAVGPSVDVRLLGGSLAAVECGGERRELFDLRAPSVDDAPALTVSSSEKRIAMALPAQLNLEVTRRTFAGTLAGMAVAAQADDLNFVRRAARAARIAAAEPLDTDVEVALEVLASFTEDLARIMPKEQWGPPKLHRVIFESATLGIVLGSREDDSGVVVEQVGDSAHERGVRVGDLVVGVAGTAIQQGARCVDVGERITTASRPLAVDFLRQAPEKKVTEPWALTVAAVGSTIAVADSFRASLADIEFAKGTTTSSGSLRVRLDARSHDAWEPAVEPSLIAWATRDDRLDLSLNGDTVDDSGDGDDESLRLNVSLPLLRAALVVRDLFSNIADAADAAIGGGKKTTTHVRPPTTPEKKIMVMEDFFSKPKTSPGLSASSLASPSRRSDLEKRSPRRETTLKKRSVVTRVSTLRLSVVEGDDSETTAQNEVLVLTLRDVVAEVAVTAELYHLSLSIDDAQLDSHLSKTRTVFPVVLRSRPRRKKLADVINGSPQDRRALLVASGSWRVAEELIVHDLTASLGKIDVFIDETAARDARDLLLRFARELSSGGQEESSRPLIVERVEISKIDARLSVQWSSAAEESDDTDHDEDKREIVTASKTLYAESVARQDKRLPSSSSQKRYSPSGAPKKKSGKYRALLDVFAAVERSKITLPALRIKEETTFEDFGAVRTFAQAHYSRGAARNALEIAGSLRALGNPLGLARGVLRGVEDAVREPVEGLVDAIDEDRPEAFALGLQRGASSLVRHTVGGTAESLANITGGLSRAASHLALDGDYQRRREPRPIFDSAVGGVVDGVTGLVQAPLRGAELEGAAGALKGVGRGVVGLVVKPVVGITDAATDLLRGTASAIKDSRRSADDLPSLERTPEPEELDEEPKQMRPHRAVYGRRRSLRPYSLRDADASDRLRAACRDVLETQPHNVDAFQQRLDLGKGVLAILTDGAFAVLRPDADPLVVAPLSLLMGCSLDHDRNEALVLVAPDSRTFATSPPRRFSVPFPDRPRGEAFRDAVAFAMTYNLPTTSDDLPSPSPPPPPPPPPTRGGSSSYQRQTHF